MSVNKGVMIVARHFNKIYGVGINDADYSVYSIDAKGKQIRCHYYSRWVDMLRRCYSENLHKKSSSYTVCYVCDEWLTFSNFKAWMETQDWEGKELDKDLLVRGNKLYSPDTVVFVTHLVNTFILSSEKNRGSYMLGTTWETANKKFIAQCKNPFTKKRENLGRFETEMGAHLAWKKRKHELACTLADTQNDIRVSNALRNRYTENTDWINV